MNKTEKANIQVRDTIIELMEKHGSDWARSWTSANPVLSRNAATGRIYKEFYNQLILGEVMAQTRQNCPYWNTYNGWQKLGYQVIDKAYGAYIHRTFPKYEKDAETGEDSKNIAYFASNTFPVYNGAHVKQATFEEVKTKRGGTRLVATLLDDAKTYAELNPLPPVSKPQGAEVIALVEKYIANTGAEVRHGSDGAFFHPTGDYISMPTRESFHSTEAYYAVLLHELTHWTGHKSRLDRLKSTKWGDSLYSFEELIAELGSAFLCNSLGISSTPRPDHAKYLNGWIKNLKNDAKGIIEASREAQKAFELLESFQPNNQLEEAA